jgi:hypothetical protein
LNDPLRSSRSGAGAVSNVIKDSTRSCEPFIATVSMIAVLGEPLFYAVWSYWLPQPYESLWLRLSVSALCIPLVFHRNWPPSLARWLPLYWHVAVMVTLPFQFTFMLLANQFCLAWILSMLFAAVLITMLLPLRLAIAIQVLGSAVAWTLSAHLLGRQVEPSFPFDEFFVVYAFALTVGIAVHHRLRQAHTLEMQSLRRLRELAQQNAALIESRNTILRRFLSKSLLVELSRLENQYGVGNALDQLTRPNRRKVALMKVYIRGLGHLSDERMSGILVRCCAGMTSIGHELGVLKISRDEIFMYADGDTHGAHTAMDVFCLACWLVDCVQDASQLTEARYPQQRLSVSVGLHAGSAIFTNIASRTLVDPTVMGRSVNLVARVGELAHSQSVSRHVNSCSGPGASDDCSSLLLMTQEFVALLDEGRVNGVTPPQPQRLDLAACGSSVRDFSGVTELYAVSGKTALSFSEQAQACLRQSIAIARASARDPLGSVPRDDDTQTDPSSQAGAAAMALRWLKRLRPAI